MRKKVLQFIILSAFILGCFFTLVWYPFTISLTIYGFGNDFTTTQYIVGYSQLIFFITASIPCFIILLVFWSITKLIDSNEVISNLGIKKMKIASKILFVDLIYFFIGNMVFLILGYNDLFPIYMLFLFVGMSFYLLVRGFGSHFKNVLKSKEKVDLTVY